MALIISTVIMLTLLVTIGIAQLHYSQRSRDFLYRSNLAVSDLAETVSRRYRKRYGRDPTGKIVVLQAARQKSL